MMMVKQNYNGKLYLIKIIEAKKDYSHDASSRLVATGRSPNTRHSATATTTTAGQATRACSRLHGNPTASGRPTKAVKQ